MRTSSPYASPYTDTLTMAPPVRLRQRRVRGDTARCRELRARERFSLNSSEDNAVSESVALASLLPDGEVLAERDLVVRVGWGDDAPGTPDGAAFLACGGMHAVQVVRADPGGRAGAPAALLRVVLEKVVKSLGWLLESSSVGRGIVVFTIAVWVPRAVPKRQRAALRRALRRAGSVDARFEFELLVPATRALRASIFPALFGSTARTPPRTTPTLVAELRALAARLAGGGGDDADDDDGGGCDVGLLGLLFLAAP